MAHTFTPEDRRKGAERRNSNMTPYERSQRASKAIYRRWYKLHDPDESRINRHLQLLSGIVGHGMAHEDYELAMRAMQIMVPYERMKIALNRGLIDGRSQPATPEQLEDQEQIEQKLLESAKRRQAKMMPTIEEAQVVPPKS